jgi:hypothetical protein
VLPAWMGACLFTDLWDIPYLYTLYGDGVNARVHGDVGIFIFSENAAVPMVAHLCCCGNVVVHVPWVKICACILRDGTVEI